MELRISTEPQLGASYEDLLKAARTAEDAGFGAFFRSDHYLPHRKAAPSTAPPTDAWITLAALARDTVRIGLGTLVTAATHRHPSVLAISAAQVHRMSGGRVELGLGSGHDETEHKALGIPLPDLRERFDRYAEQLEIMCMLLKPASVRRQSFTGSHYQLQGVPALYEPDLPPPPLIIGGRGKHRTPALAARFADEFNVIFCDAGSAADQFARVERAASATGRAGEIIRSAALPPAVGRTQAETGKRLEALRRKLPWLFTAADSHDVVLAGSPAEVVDMVGQYQEATGISRLYLTMADIADVAQIELIASDVMPQLRTCVPG